MLEKHLAKKHNKYANTELVFFPDEYFLNALEKAEDPLAKANVIDNLLSHLRENTLQAEEAIAYLKEQRALLQPQKAKKIIINCNGTCCPAYLHSAHEDYMMPHLGERDTAVFNVPGVGIDAQKPHIANLWDLSYGYSVPARVQSVLDFIRDNAAEDCSIEILGHSRGAVETIIAARIVSQKYPNVKVIAHDPVPADRSLPLVQPSYYELSLDTAHFLPEKPSLTIAEVLSQPELKIRGSLLLPWRRDDKRTIFALLDGDCVYEADSFYPVEQAGFHNMGIYEYTPVDYAVFAKDRFFFDRAIKNLSRKAGQGEVDDARPLTKALFRRQYGCLVNLFMNSEVIETKDIREYQIRCMAELREQGLAQSEVSTNPNFHRYQRPGRRVIPAALDVWDDASFDEDMYEFVRSHSQKGEVVPYTSLALEGLVEKITYLPSLVNNTDLFYALWYWILAQGKEPTAMVESLRYCLFSNAQFTSRVETIARACNLQDLVQELIHTKVQFEASFVADSILLAVQSLDSDCLRKKLALTIADHVRSPDITKPVSSLLLEHYSNGGPEELDQWVQQQALLKTLLPAALGLVLGVAMGITLVATGVFAPFGLGALGMFGLAAIMGGGLFIITGSLALVQQGPDPLPVPELELETPLCPSSVY